MLVHKAPGCNKTAGTLPDDSIMCCQEDLAVLVRGPVTPSWCGPLWRHCSHLHARRHLLRGSAVQVASAALKSVATAFSLSSVATQGMPEWHTDLELSGAWPYISPG